jgi:hypothetical protein
MPIFLFEIFLLLCGLLLLGIASINYEPSFRRTDNGIEKSSQMTEMQGKLVSGSSYICGKI